jgi:hypothetical protein
MRTDLSVVVGVVERAFGHLMIDNEKFVVRIMQLAPQHPSSHHIYTAHTHM